MKMLVRDPSDLNKIKEANLPTVRGVTSVTSTASLTIDSSTTKQGSVTALAVAMTINNPSNGSDGDKIVIRIHDNGTSRALTWGSSFNVVGTTLPIATTPNKIHYIGCIYNSNTTNWDVVAVTEQA